jgi:adenosylcobinamide-GDP ribazoletransferase
MRSILLAIQFLTILPVRLRGDISERDVARCASAFPVVGALQGFMILISAIVLARFFTLDVVSGFVIAIMVIINGGFHLDGIADTFDALAVKSSGDPDADKQKRLAVMKDSTNGAIGITAIVILILLKFVLIKSVLSFPVFVTGFLVLSLMPVFSKWIMVPPMYHGMSARKDGLGSMLLADRSPRRVLISTALISFIFAAVSAAHFVKYYGLQSMVFLAILPLGYLFAMAAAAFCEKRFGGLTGDTLGALSELSEIIYLTGSSIWLRHFI